MSDDLTNLGLIDDEEILLDEAALTLALLDHPDVDLSPYDRLLDDIAERLKDAGGEVVSAHDRAQTLARVIGGEFGFAGDVLTYDDPANADLIRVLDRRRGLPVSLSILYVAAARRIGWIAAALDVPGHVLVLVGDEASPVVIDPFRMGRMLSVAELTAILTATGRPEGPVHHVATMPNRAVLVRLLLNQATRAEAAGQGRRALTLYRRMTVMAPEYVHAWWESARLDLIDSDVDEARRSLTTILEITREADLRARVTSLLSSLGSGS